MTSARILDTDHRVPGRFIIQLGLVLFAVTSIVAYLIWSGYRDDIRGAESETRNYAAILDARLDATLRRADSELAQLAQAIPAAALDRGTAPRYAGELDARLASYLVNFPELGSLLVFDAEGERLYSSSQSTAQPLNISDRAHFRELRDKPGSGLIFSEVVTSRITGKSSVYVGRALNDGQGVFRGALFAGLSIDHFQSLFQSLNIGAHGVVSWRNSKDHKLLLRWPTLSSEVNRPLSPEHPVVRMLAEGRLAGTLRYTNQVDAIDRVNSYKALETYPFYIYVGFSLDDVLADWRKRTLVIGVFSLLLMALLVGMLFHLRRAVIREERAMVELQESEERSRRVLAISPDGIWIHRNGRIVYANEMLAKMLGYGNAQQFVGRSIHDFFVPEFREALGERVARAVNSIGSVPLAETRMLRQDGTSVAVETKVVAYRQGAEVLCLSVLRDITERARAEEALRQSEGNLRQMLDAMLEGCQIISSDWRYRYLNDAAQAHNRRPREELLGRTMMECWPGIAESEVFALVKRCMEQRIALSQECEFTFPDGSKGWFKLIVQPVPQGIAIYSEDISERRRAQEELRLLNQKLETKVAERTAELERANLTLALKEEESRSAVYHMVDCVITIDERGIIHSANPVVEKTFGYTPAELLGQNISMLMAEPDRTFHDDYLANYRRTGRANIIGIGREVHGLHKNGERIPLDLAISEYRIQGQHFFTGILRDIRQRLRIMKDLELARIKADQASQAKSAFLAAMSHEIRTPMNGVIGMVDVLHQTSLKGYQVEIVDIIRDSANSLLGIIEDILDFSKIEAGRLEVECEAVAVASVVQQVCELLENIAFKKNVEFTVFIDPAIPDQVLGDALRLRQILVNLGSNAIKFSSQEERPGKVALRVHMAEAIPERVTLEFQVIDNGIGMDAETEARLFTSFSQADLSTTRRFGGTGLGLAISGQLAKLMGGEIVVASAPGVGSTFTARLPFALPPGGADSSHAAAAISDEAKVAGLSCLVVGGAESLADDLAVYLRYAGALVERVPDLAAAAPEGATHVGAAIAGLWVIDAGAASLSPEELRSAAGVSADRDVRFVLVGRGHRREPRLVAADLVAIDGNALGRQAFLRAVAIAAGRLPPDAATPDSQYGAALTLPSHEEARRLGRLILVAEDNETNQKVILWQLGLLGFAADVVDNGHDALESWRGGDYALLLSDLHMPQMDGYELATAIRTVERGLTHTPIVALTANALAGEAARCRAAGMDDYLAKPAPLAKLKAVLDKWLPADTKADPRPVAGTAVAMPAPEPGCAKPALDVSVLCALVGEDSEVVRGFLQDFRASSAKLAGELCAASAAGRAKEAGAIAHKLKSSARSVGARQLGQLCAELEQAGNAVDRETLATLLPGFRQELLAVESCLEVLLQQRS